MGLGAIMLSSGDQHRKSLALPVIAAGAALLLTTVQLTTHAIGPVPVGDDPIKDLYRLSSDPAKGGEIIESRWSLFGRTDLVKHPGDPDEMNLFVDGTAGTPLYRFSGDPLAPGAKAEAMKRDFTGYFPFLTLKDNQRDSILIIGPGGGRDVLAALMGGFREIIGVEVNPQLVEMVREQGAFTGNIYSGFENVKVVVDEGRNFVKRSTGPYDMVLLTLPVTKSSRSVEGYALTESFLLTTEAILDYWNRLSPEGQVVVVLHNGDMALRLLSVVTAALAEIGIPQEEVFRHLCIVGWGLTPTVVLRKSPISPEEAASMKELLVRTGYASNPGFFPGEGGAGDDPVLKALNYAASGKATMERIAEVTSIDISPVTDDSPFFYKFEKGLPTEVATILIVALAGTVVTAALPLTRRREGTVHGRGIAVFGLIGFSFMAAEVVLIQKLMLFIGQPTVTLGVVLIALLTGISAGSRYSAGIPAERLAYVFRRNALITGILLLGYILFLPLITSALLGWGLALRMEAAFVILFPVGFFAGGLFPAGMRVCGGKGGAPWLWAVNGTASVLGSVTAVAIAMKLGFSAALLAAGAGYLVTSAVGLAIIARTDVPTKGPEGAKGKKSAKGRSPK